MKICNVTNTAEFLDRLGKCEGEVYVVTPDGGLQDIKRYVEGIRSLRWMGGWLNLTKEFELRFEKRDDAMRVLRFLVEGNPCAA